MLSEQEKMEWARRFEQKRQQVKRLNPAAKPTKMTRASDVVSMRRLPDHVFACLGGVAIREEALRVCDVCGVIEPKPYVNGYVPVKCACQRAEEERDRAQKQRMEVWKVQQLALARECEKCYTWLGPEWSEPGLEDKTFANFNMDLQSDGFLEAYAFAERIVARSSDDTQPLAGNLVLWGSNGTGKTHLAAAICNMLSEQKITSLFTTGQNLFNAFGARFDQDRGAEDLISLAGDAKGLLVIDDICKTYMGASGYKKTIFFNILNRRYLKKLPTLITTNEVVSVIPTGISGISEYIGSAACSRMKEHGLKTACMNGRDYRHYLGQQM